MIYFVRGLEQADMKPYDSNKSDFETIISVKPTLISTESKFKIVKTRNGAETTLAKRDLCFYFISGEMKAMRKLKTNISSRRLLVLDFDNKERLPINQIKQAVHEGLGEFSYYLYPSTSYTGEHPRIRLIVDSEGDINEEAYKQTITDLAGLVELTLDGSSEGFAQIQGLPCTDDLEVFNRVKVINHGKQFPVSEVADVPTQQASTYQFSFNKEGYPSESKGKTISMLETSMRGVGEGERNVTMTKFFGILLRAKMQPSIAVQFCRDLNDKYFLPPLSDRELFSVLESISAREMKKSEVKHE